MIMMHCRPSAVHVLAPHKEDPATMQPTRVVLGLLVLHTSVEGAILLDRNMRTIGGAMKGVPVPGLAGLAVHGRFGTRVRDPLVQALVLLRQAVELGLVEVKVVPHEVVPRARDGALL